MKYLIITFYTCFNRQCIHLGILVNQLQTLFGGKKGICELTMENIPNPKHGLIWEIKAQSTENAIGTYQLQLIPVIC